jgi:hypothetical protein
MNSTIRWQFIRMRKARRAEWTWRRLRPSGSVEKISQPQRDFGKAVVDAINSGFKPRMEEWVVITEGVVSHFEPARKPAFYDPEEAAPISGGAYRSLRRKKTKAPRKPSGSRAPWRSGKS